MKIYRLETICKDAKTHAIAEDIAANCGGYVSLQGEGANRIYTVFKRAEYLRDWHLEGKALLKMLPAWAKAAMKAPPSIGHKVTAFYAINNKVVTDCSGIVIGSDEYYEWVETQPDPFRSCRIYRQSLGELRC